MSQRDDGTWDGVTNRLRSRRTEGRTVRTESLVKEVLWKELRVFGFVPGRHKRVVWTPGAES